MIANEHGMTLAEILVAVFIIGVGLVGLLVVVPVAAVGVQEGSQMSLATFLAQQRLEQARNAEWTSTKDCLGVSPSPTAAPTPSSGACDTVAVTFPDEATGEINGYPPFWRTTRIFDCGVDDCAGVDHDGFRRVQVTVGYRPLTATGVAVYDKTVILEWMVTRQW